MSTAAPIPLTLLGGFLGAGKSTLVARLIRQPGFARTAVIVNEFGEVGIDHALIARGSEDNVVLLDSGCICCTLTSSLEDTLEALYYRRERGELGSGFDRVVVETTGLADPGPIAAALAGGMFVSRYFRLSAIVVAVDALHGAQQIAAHEEARRQIAVADRIILTKTDLDNDGAAQRTWAAIRAINPLAPVLAARHGEIEPELLVSDVPVQRFGAIVGEAAPRGVAHEHEHGHDHDHDDHGHDHPPGSTTHLQDHGYVTVSVRLPGSVAWPRYAAWVAGLQAKAGTRLLRAKGFLRFDDGIVRAIQGVQLLFATPVPLDGPIDESLVGTVVLIAHGMDEPALCELLGPLFSPPSHPAPPPPSQRQ